VNLLVAILVLPFIGAFLGYYLGFKNENIRNVYNIILTAVELVLIIMVYPELKNGPVEYVMQNSMFFRDDVFHTILNQKEKP